VRNLLARLRPHLPVFTALSLIAGLLAGSFLQGKTRDGRPMDEGGFLREVDGGPHMPIIVLSPDLTPIINNPSSVADAVSHDKPFSLTNTLIKIPDSYASSMFDCGPTASKREPWFSGQLEAESEAFREKKSDALDDRHLAAQFRATGSLYKCNDAGEKILVATGVSITAPSHPPSILAVQKRVAYASYSAFLGNLYLTFLMMLFLPTLAISVVQAIVESAKSDSFRYLFLYFISSSLIGATIGAGVAFIAVETKIISHNTDKDHLTIIANSLGGQVTKADYDPHPVLTQLGRIIPTNPLGALTDPSGNSGLQVAFIAVLLGLVLAALGAAYRTTIAGYLKSALALVISDRELKWTALSDFADFFAPVGVFFFAMTAFASADFKLLHDLFDLLVVILLALCVHILVVLIWLRFFRNSNDWVRRALIPGLSGLVTALATASSYAALPAISDVPLLQSDSRKRGLFNLGTTLNKNGTSVYLAASATFLYLLYNGVESPWRSLVEIILLSTLAGVVVAGLPFAAIVGLRMVLVGMTPGALAWLLLPIDPLADRLVTPVNVFCNLAAASDPKEVFRKKILPI
jgi:Na+/H+-dicarboxylate symporter